MKRDTYQTYVCYKLHTGLQSPPHPVQRLTHSPTEQVLYVLVGGGGGLSHLAWDIGTLASEQLAYPTAYDVAHLQFSVLLANTGTHLRVRVDDDRQEHVLEKYRSQY